MCYCLKIHCKNGNSILRSDLSYSRNSKIFNVKITQGLINTENARGSLPDPFSSGNPPLYLLL